jgi:hypothetical protein
MSPAVRGTCTPTERQARWTSPEQSKHDGPVPPQQYGVPTRAQANCTTAHDCAVGGGSRPVHARATSEDGGGDRSTEHPESKTQATAAANARIVAHGRA